MAKRTSIQITESTKSVSAKIIAEAVEQIDRKMRSAAPQINARVGQLIETKLRSTPHAREILSGKLRADFGLTDSAANTAVQDLIEAVKRSVKVNLDIRGRGSLGNLAWSMSVSILPDGFTDTIKQIGAYKSRSGEIDWMDWLLTKGVTIIYDDYFVAYGKEFPGSRSGNAIMLPAGSSGRLFRVDPVFAGTTDDNFVVNTVNSLLPEIAKLMFSYLQ